MFYKNSFKEFVDQKQEQKKRLSATRSLHSHRQQLSGPGASFQETERSRSEKYSYEKWREVEKIQDTKEITGTLLQNQRTIQRMRDMIRNGGFGLNSSSRGSLSRSFAYPDEEHPLNDLGANLSYEKITALQPRTTLARKATNFGKIFEIQEQIPPVSSSSLFNDQSMRESLLRNKLSPIAPRVSDQNEHLAPLDLTKERIPRVLDAQQQIEDGLQEIAGTFEREMPPRPLLKDFPLTLVSPIHVSKELSLSKSAKQQDSGLSQIQTSSQPLIPQKVYERVGDVELERGSQLLKLLSGISSGSENQDQKNASEDGLIKELEDNWRLRKKSKQDKPVSGSQSRTLQFSSKDIEVRYEKKPTKLPELDLSDLQKQPEGEGEEGSQAEEESLRRAGDQIIDYITRKIYAQIVDEELKEGALFPTRRKQVSEDDAIEIEIISDESLPRIPAIDTSSGSMQVYIDSIFDDLKPHSVAFLGEFDTPIRRPAQKYLKILAQMGVGTGAHLELQSDGALHALLPLKLYMQEQKRRERSGSKEEDFAQENQQIHHKAVFDAMNETLNELRPYGLEGEPGLWSNKPRYISFKKLPYNELSFERVRDAVKARVMGWGQMRVGSKQMHDQKERRLAQLLAIEVVENEPNWLSYDHQEAQIKLDLADMVMSELVSETAELLSSIEQKQAL